MQKRKALILHKQTAAWAFLILLTIVFSACTGPAVPASPAELNTIRGQISGTGELWPDAEIWVFAAPYQSGVFMLDSEHHPHVRLGEDGTFVFEAAPAGTYVLLVGPEAAAAVLITDNSGAPLVVSADPATAVDIGKYSLP